MAVQMHEDEKLQEADYFLRRICELQEAPSEFRFVLSAFLTASRSVLQYALEEAKGKAGGQARYDRTVTAPPTIAFFKDKRDINIHGRPVSYNQTIHVGTGEIRVSAPAATLIVTDRDGNVISEDASEKVVELPCSPQPARRPSHTYEFGDWKGRDNDVVALCQN